MVEGLADRRPPPLEAKQLLVDQVRECDRAELLNRIQAGAPTVVVDVRSAEERADGYLRGSLAIPFDTFLAADPPAVPHADTWVVFLCMYCAERGPRAAHTFQRAFPEAEVRILHGGFSGLVDDPAAGALLESLNPARWVPRCPRGQQGMIWRPDAFPEEAFDELEVAPTAIEA